MSRHPWLALALALMSATPGSALAEGDISGRYRIQPGGTVVAIGHCDAGALCGRVIALGDLPTTDANNPAPALRERRLCGLAVLNDLKWRNGSWQGAFYDPHTGSDYQISMMLSDTGAVSVSGYSGKPVLSRRMARSFEVWERIAAPDEFCGNAAATS